MFVESPEAAAPTKKLRKGLSKVFGRKDSDSEGETECMDATSGVGEAEEALEGHLFSVGVAFAQVSSPCTRLAHFPGLLCNSCNLAAIQHKLHLLSLNQPLWSQLTKFTHHMCGAHLHLQRTSLPAGLLHVPCAWFDCIHCCMYNIRNLFVHVADTAAVAA